MKTERMTILLTATGELTAGVLECARVARAITLQRARIEISDVEIAATKKRLAEHLKRFRALRKSQVRRLAAQQSELRFQMKRLKAMKGATPCK